MNAARFFAVLLLPATILLVACDEEIVVRQRTEVYADGSLYRSLDIRGRTSDGEIPVEPDWLRREAGVALAEPEAWRILEHRPDGLTAEAVFASADRVPVALAHETDQGTVVDRADVGLDVQDLVVLTRRVYEEHLADPFGDTSLEAALDALTELASATLAEELRRELGSRIDVAPAVTFVRTEARVIVGELLGILRQGDVPGESPALGGRLSRVLARHGITPSPELAGARDRGDALGELLDPLLLWARDRVAELAGDAGDRIAGQDLSFWPDGRRLAELAGTTTDDPEDPRVVEFRRAADALWRSLEGYYGNPSSAGFRLECRVEQPGRLLRTNGTPVEEGVTWVIDNEQLTGGVTMRTESVEPDIEALTRLGARRDLDTTDLLLLTDLLTDREHGPLLREALARAVEQGGFDPLADERLAEEVGNDARTLLELLDPTVNRWP